MADKRRAEHKPGRKAKRKEQKPQGYWTDFANLKRELRAFVAQRGEGKLAQRAGLHLHAHPRGYWEDFANLEREIRTFMQAHECGDVLPTLKDLIAAGSSSIVYAIGLHGGVYAVAWRLGRCR